MLIFQGPLASDVIIHQHMNTTTREHRLLDFVPAPDARFIDKLKRIRKERMFMLDRSKGEIVLLHMKHCFS